VKIDAVRIEIVGHESESQYTIRCNGEPVAQYRLLLVARYSALAISKVLSIVGLKAEYTEKGIING
jgi:hypothetical protein